MEERRLAETAHALVAFEMKGSVCKKCRSKVPSHGGGGRSPEQLGEIIVHKDVEESLEADLMGFKYSISLLMREVGKGE